jgi:peptidoglycan/xylan/chitin deacetylase (PgdA/CDA1 family)
MNPTQIAEGAFVGACTLASAAAVLADAALLPGSQLFGRTLVAGRDPRELALTYDDGPNDEATPALLDLFAEHGIRASFFMIGRFAQQRPEMARRVFAAGHVVGNHTMNHPNLAYLKPPSIRREMRDCQHVLEDVLGAPVKYFRPPHGARRPFVLREARELGLTVVQWNAMGYDWRPITAGEIAAHIRRGMQRAERRSQGTNVVLHDGWDKQMGADRSRTVEATRALLAEGVTAGKRFVAVDAWA